MNRERFQIGDRVRVGPKHWLRSNHEGKIVGYEPRRSHIWLVEFDIKDAGLGFDDGGKLYMDDVEIQPVKVVRRRKAA